MYPFNPKYAALMAKTRPNTQMYQVIEIGGERLRYEAYAVSGEMVDGFELRKASPNKTTITELRDIVK